MVSQATKKSISQNEFFNSILAEFSKTFGSASSEHPNVRCLSKPALVSEFVQLRNRLAHPGFKEISGKAILDNLVQSGLVHAIPLIDPNTDQPIEKLFSIGLNEASLELDPVELLQAIVPSGAVCYFTAIQFHDLSTQIPAHHHIAQIVDTPPKNANSSTDTPSRRISSKRPTRKVDPLGQRQFLYQDIPYYVTTRSRRRMPGIQDRYFTNKTVISITTYEQTLIDTLHHPLSCGGPSVVFEAWENAVSGLDQDRLLNYLQEIDDEQLNRRVGYLLTEHLEHELETQLDNYLQRTKRTTISDQMVTPVSLLPGYQYSHTSLEWRLEVP